MPTVLAGAHDEAWRSRRPGRSRHRSSIEALAPPQSPWSRRLHTALPLAWKLTLLASIVLSVLLIRLLVFDYTHGGHEVAHKLVDFLLP